MADAWLLKYNASQINDGATLGSCPIQPTFLNFMNGEALNDNGDVVLWIRGGAVHQGGQLDTCTRVGPTLTPVGDWAP